jgi:transcriptional regulator with XRE-family HTH domain
MSIDAQRSSAKERGKRLRLVRKMSGLTLNEISAKYDLGISTIKYWECAKNQGLSSKGAKKIIFSMHKEGIQVSYMWLMHGIGLPPQFLDVRYNKENKNMDMVEHSAYEDEKAIESEIALFCDRIESAMTLTLIDDSMEPLYSLNDSVGGKRLYGSDICKSVGKNCIVETSDSQLLCRRVAQGNELNNFNLYSINPNTLASPPHLYGVKLLSVAPISRIWKRGL